MQSDTSVSNHTAQQLLCGQAISLQGFTYSKMILEEHYCNAIKILFHIISQAICNSYCVPLKPW